MKDLILINDAAIRLDAFSEAEKLLKKLDRFEEDLKSFHDHDQRLFASWFALSFRDQQKHLSQLHTELRDLIQFHNWLIAITKMRGLAMQEAFALLRNEALQYQNGSAEIRAWIEEERRKRDDFIQQEMQNKSEPSAEDNDHDNKTSQEPLPPRDEEQESLFTELTRMSPRKINMLCKDRSTAFHLLGMALNLARTDDEKALFLRIWDQVPRQHQNSFSMHFMKETGTPLKPVIEEMREDLDNRSPHHKKAVTDHHEANSDSNSAPKGPEYFKLLYRKIVRRLHPDLQLNQQEPSLWQKKMWHRVQTAHHKQDHPELEKILRLVLIRSRDLQELTLAEILESQSWLEEELELMSGEVKELKQQPAWGFSRRKSYDALKRKLERSFRRDMQPLEDQLHELKSEHALLELLPKAGRPLKKSKPSKRERPSSRGPFNADFSA